MSLIHVTLRLSEVFELGFSLRDYVRSGRLQMASSMEGRSSGKQVDSVLWVEFVNCADLLTARGVVASVIKTELRAADVTPRLRVNL
jgi:hypothetical protein